MKRTIFPASEDVMRPKFPAPETCVPPAVGARDGRLLARVFGVLAEIFIVGRHLGIAWEMKITGIQGMQRGAGA